MSKVDIKKVVYGSETIEFVTVAVEYCIFLESFQGLTIEEFTGKMTKILPLLYLKAQLLPETEKDEDTETADQSVTEEDYNFILEKVTAVMAQYNDYLEVFVQDMRYSDEPILAHIAENLADIYQDIRNFVAVYQRGIEEHMYDALLLCISNFKHYWGQSLVNVLRALHTVQYPTVEESFQDDDFNESEDDSELW